MKKLNLTVGYVGLDGVVLKDDSAFNKGDVVLVISAESFDDFLNELNEIKKDLEKSKDWINDIKRK